MQTTDYWKQFENTGKIEDYLVYKSGFAKEKDSDIVRLSATNRQDKEVSDKKRQQGAGPYAGIY